MARLKIAFNPGWMNGMGITMSPLPKSLAFDTEGETVRDALFSAFKSHHTYVRRLFNDDKELVIPRLVKLYLNRQGGRWPIGGGSSDKELEDMLDLPLEDGWELYISFPASPG